MKHILLLLFLSSFGALSAQNYQCVLPESMNFYFNGNYELISTSISKASGTPDYYKYYSFDSLYQKPDSAVNGICKYYLDKSWIGKYISVSNDGWTSFYTPDDDSININVNAQLNDTFTVYSDDNGIQILAKVDSVVARNVFGMMDSVKVIRLYSYHPQYLHINSNFLLSKNNGLLKLVSPNKFLKCLKHRGTPIELVGYKSKGVRHGITRLTHREANTFEVGDEFFYEESFYDGGFRSFIFKKIILQNFGGGKYQVMELRQFSWYYLDTLIYEIQYDFSNEPIAKNMPGEAPYFYENKVNWEVKMLISHPEELHLIIPNNYMLNRNCIGKSKEIEDRSLRFKYTHRARYKKGFGQIYVYDLINSNRAESIELVGYKKADGRKLDYEKYMFIMWDTSSYVNTIDYNISIGPNPSKGELNLQLPKGVEHQIIVSDIKGNLVFSSKTNEPYFTIDLNFLQNGLYLVEVESDQNYKLFRWFKYK